MKKMIMTFILIIGLSIKAQTSPTITPAKGEMVLEKFQPLPIGNYSMNL